MKTACLILLIVGYVQVCGVAYASVASDAPQQSSGNSSTTGAGSDYSANAEHATVSTESRDHKAAIDSDERAGGHHVSDKTRPHGLPTPSKSNRAKQVRHNHEQSRPEHVTSMRQPVKTNPFAPARKVVDVHTLPVRPATGVAISGQQFRNGRNRSATPAVIGGPTSARRNVAAINGTEVNRKHAN